MNSATLRQEAVCGTLRFLPVGLLARCSGNGVLIPYYHMISGRELLHIKNLYPYKNEKEFTADLDFLLRHFRPVTLWDVIASTRGGGPLPSRSFLLTFDDGFREMADVVAPILLRKGVPAVFFVGQCFHRQQVPLLRSQEELDCRAHQERRLPRQKQGDQPFDREGS